MAVRSTCLARFVTKVTTTRDQRTIFVDGQTTCLLLRPLLLSSEFCKRINSSLLSVQQQHTTLLPSAAIVIETNYYSSLLVDCDLFATIPSFQTMTEATEADDEAIKILQQWTQQGVVW